MKKLFFICIVLAFLADGAFAQTTKRQVIGGDVPDLTLYRGSCGHQTTICKYFSSAKAGSGFLRGISLASFGTGLDYHLFIFGFPHDNIAGTLYQKITQVVGKKCVTWIHVGFNGKNLDEVGSSYRNWGIPAGQLLEDRDAAEYKAKWNLNIGNLVVRVNEDNSVRDTWYCGDISAFMDLLKELRKEEDAIEETVRILNNGEYE